MCAGLANWRSRQHVSSDDATRALQLLTVAMDVTAVKTCKTDGSRRGSAAQRGQQGDATGGPDEHSVVVPLPRQVVAQQVFAHHGAVQHGQAQNEGDEHAVHSKGGRVVGSEHSCWKPAGKRPDGMQA